MAISEQQRRSNEATKQRILGERAFRTAAPANARPLAQLAATEKKVNQELKAGSSTGFSKFSGAYSKYSSYAGAAASRTVRSAGSATKVVVTGAGRAANTASAAAKTVSASDSGMVLFIAGLAVFLFDLIFKIDNFWLALVIATFFMFYSALTIFQGEGIIFVSLFFIWYILLGGRTDPAFIRYYAVPLALVGMLLHGFIKKARNSGTFGEGASGELKGFIPILFFMLDIGLINILTNYFRLPLTAININILGFVPWWSLLGLKYTNSDKGWVTWAKVLAIFYIFILAIGGLGPGVYGKYLQTSLLAGPQEAFQARLDAQQGVKAENPLKSYGTCFLTGRFTELDVCVREEQRKSLAESTCKNIGISSGADLERCIKDETARLERGGAKGATDITKKEFLEAEFKPVTTSFPRLVFNEPRKSYPVTLLIKNPLQQQISVEANCNFTRGSVSVSGKTFINGQEGASYSSNLKNEPLNILCTPNSDLEGRYTLEVKATLSNIVTTTTLTRAFVKSPEDKERWEAEIKSRALSSFSAGLSSSAPEFARLNYGFGNFPEDPIIITNQPIVFTASIEDLGKGQLTRIRSYLLSSLLQKGFFPASGDQNCLQRGEIIIPQKVKSYHLGECFLELPTDYQQFELPFIVDTFEAQLIYDYTLTQKIPGIEVKKS